MKMKKSIKSKKGMTLVLNRLQMTALIKINI